MAIQVLIKRTIPENKIKEVIPLFRQIRGLAMEQPGYISGATLKSLDNPNTYLVISTWNSLAHWKRWFLSKERQELQDEIDSLLEKKTKYEIYNFGFTE